MERIFASVRGISVEGPSHDPEEWYFVDTTATMMLDSDDYTWMLNNKPTVAPFIVTSKNYKNYQELALKQA